MMRPRWLGCLVLLAISCGAPRPQPETAPPGPTAPTPVEAAPAAPVLTLHEWGLVDVDLASGVAELSTGPGQPARPVVARKPVIYAHLDGAEHVSTDVRVRLPGGRLLEHWPAADVEAETLAWRVDVRQGACPSARGPLRDLPSCDAPDGTCEVRELPRYVTDDHDCMDVAGTAAPLLFYRAQIPIGALPLSIRREPDLSVRIGDPGAASAPRPILRTSTRLAASWAPGQVLLSRAERAPGDIVVPVGTEPIDPAAERAAMERVLVDELGSTPSEAGVFLEAWERELFFAPGVGPTRVASRRARAWPPADAILYWLSQDEIARIAPLESTAPVGLRRAWLVRVSLGAPGVASPSP